MLDANSLRDAGKERFDALMKLADFRLEIRDSRRQHEWRVSLGLWIGMGAAMVSLRDVPLVILIIALPSTVFCHAWFWVRWNWNSGERDIRLAHFYAETAENLLLDDAPKPDKRTLTKKDRRFGFFRHGPPIFQVLATTLLAIGMAILCSRPIVHG